MVGPGQLAAGRPGGALEGVRFGAKDLFDVAGTRTGAGNPDWLADAPVAAAHAPAVGALLAAGADLWGKTVTDELAFSLSGTNVHYGTPLNERAPGRIPGGSSSGSASAVAGGAVGLALGTDTGVRCGPRPRTAVFSGLPHPWPHRRQRLSRSRPELRHSWFVGPRRPRSGSRLESSPGWGRGAGAGGTGRAEGAAAVSPR
jgi:hypothetical protein